MIALQYTLKSESLMPAALLFFLNIALAICGYLWFHTCFEIIFSIPIKNTFGILKRITLNP